MMELSILHISPIFVTEMIPLLIIMEVFLILFMTNIMRRHLKYGIMRYLVSRFKKVS